MAESWRQDPVNKQRTWIDYLNSHRHDVEFIQLCKSSHSPAPGRLLFVDFHSWLRASPSIPSSRKSKPFPGFVSRRTIWSDQWCPWSNHSTSRWGKAAAWDSPTTDSCTSAVAMAWDSRSPDYQTWKVSLNGGELLPERYFFLLFQTWCWRLQVNGSLRAAGVMSLTAHTDTKKLNHTERAFHFHENIFFSSFGFYFEKFIRLETRRGDLESAMQKKMFSCFIILAQRPRSLALNNW